MIYPGGEGGVRTINRLATSVGCRSNIAKNAIDARKHCPLLPAANGFQHLDDLLLVHRAGPFRMTKAFLCSLALRTTPRCLPVRCLPPRMVPAARAQPRTARQRH